MTEYQKMQNGMIYDTQDKEPGQVQKHSHRLCEQYNRLGVDDEGQCCDKRYSRGSAGRRKSRKSHPQNHRAGQHVPQGQKRLSP